MSLTSSYRTSIVVPKPQLAALHGNIRGNPCMQIMSLALEKVTKERGGQALEGYYDCLGNLHTTLLGLKTADFPSGIGVDVDSDGCVVFRFDRKNADVSVAKNICDDLARAYAVIAVLRAHRARGYNVQVEHEEFVGNCRAVRIAATAV